LVVRLTLRRNCSLPLDDRPHRLDMDAVRAREPFLERAVAVALDEFGLLTIRQADLPLDFGGRGVGRCAFHLRQLACEHPSESIVGVR
jgi:hypothetical protein